MPHKMIKFKDNDKNRILSSRIWQYSERVETDKWMSEEATSRTVYILTINRTLLLEYYDEKKFKADIQQIDSIYQVKK